MDPNSDPLSDVLSSVQLRGGIFYYVSCRDAWVAETPNRDEMLDAICPGAEHVIAYHLFIKGGGWAETHGLPTEKIDPGDIIVFPQGDPHVLSSTPGMRAQGANSEWRYMVRNFSKPITMSYHMGVCQPGADMPVEEAETVFMCGFLSCDLRPFNPLIASLPRVLRLPAHSVGQWVMPMLNKAVEESRLRLPGSSAMLEHVGKIVFVDVARRYLESLPEGEGQGWLAALRDRQIGRAIGLMHTDPAQSWTVEDLGKRVGLSRSAFHERFQGRVGLPPMQYLANWRLQCGARKLRETTDTIATIAQEIGYESEAAFSRAFKRLLGQTPGVWRSARRAA